MKRKTKQRTSKNKLGEFMKKILSIFNILSFLFISYIIFVEEFITENDMFPSFLYKRAEKLGSIFKYYTNP